MAALPLVRARYALSFAQSLESMRVSSLPVLVRARIPERVLEDPDALIPVTRLCALVGHAARAADRRDLGWHAAQGALERIAAFATTTLGAPTLRLALEDFCWQAQREYTRPVFWVEEQEDELWFCRGHFEGEPLEGLQLEIYVAAMMLQAVRAYAGPRWRPRVLWVQALPGSGVEDCRPLRAENLCLGRPILGMPVARALLASPPISGREPEHPAMPSSLGTTSDDSVNGCLASLEQLIRAYLSSGGPSVALTAEAVGVSVRSLQRRLADLGTSHSELIQAVRMERARGLLSDTECRLDEIAAELGYSHAAHFTRAFRRCHGVTPSEFRNRC